MAQEDSFSQGHYKCGQCHGGGADSQAHAGRPRTVGLVCPVRVWGTPVKVVMRIKYKKKKKKDPPTQPGAATGSSEHRTVTKPALHLPLLTLVPTPTDREVGTERNLYQRGHKIKTAVHKVLLF